jgi:aspartyl/asparaginyl-tRNA synthetase
VYSNEASKQTTTNHAIFKLQAQVSKFFRDYLDGKGFTEIHSPKLQGAATESGASVFKVSYFKGDSSQSSLTAHAR